MSEMPFVDIYSGSIDSLPDANTWSLSEDERKKAGAFKTLALQHDFIRMRVMLRRILAQYLGCEDQQLQFAYNEYGKPFLPGSGLFFNLSHSHRHWSLAVSHWSEVGMDIEYIRHRTSLSGLVNKTFAESEQVFWHQQTQNQERLFYWFWVRKEAWVKAIGRGIAVGLNACEIDLKQPGKFTAIPSEYGLPQDWQHVQLKCHADYEAALVVKSGVFELHYREAI